MRRDGADAWHLYVKSTAVTVNTGWIALPGQEFDYEAITANPAGITATTEGTSQAVITGNSVYYDGSRVKVSFCVPKVVVSWASSRHSSPFDSEETAQLVEQGRSRSIFSSAFHELTHAAGRAKEVGLEVGQEAPYAAYYAAFTTLDQAKKHHIPRSPTEHLQLVELEAVGLAGNLGFDLARRKSIWDDARKDSVLPNFVAKKWNPKFLQWYLPGTGRDKHGHHKVDFRW